jgi:carbamoyl-phosphate synthase / aspartate carbamoyltransferase / dihydroorotase
MSTLQLPGLIDPHVHLREPGGRHKEDFHTGSLAALAGGITAVLAMPNTNPPLVDEAALAMAEAGAKARAICDYGLYLGASPHNIRTAPSMAPRVVGLKFYLDATFGPLLIHDLNTIRQHFAHFPKDRPIACHAEGRAVAAVILAAHLANRSVHICHVSRREEIEVIRDAKERGMAVTCEVCPHHLFLTEEDIPRIGLGRGEVRPRLATPDDQAGLWENMAYIDCLATDHAPHTLAEKDSDTPPPGFPGLETSLALMLTAVHAGKIDLDGVIHRMSDNPRRIFGLPEQPHTHIEIDTDLVWSPQTGAMFSRSNWTPFHGWNLRGRVIRVVLRGHEVYQHGQFATEGIHGRNLAPAENT